MVVILALPSAPMGVEQERIGAPSDPRQYFVRHAFDDTQLVVHAVDHIDEFLIAVG